MHATAVFIESQSVSSTGGDAPAEKQKREGDDIFAEPKAVGIWTVGIRVTFDVMLRGFSALHCQIWY